MDNAVIIECLSSAIRVSAPIILIAIGVSFSEKAGVYAMNAEGYMLIAAFASVMVTVLTHSLAWGVIAGILVGIIVSWIYSLLVLKLGADQVLCGLGTNFAVIGLTSSLQRLFWGVTGIPRIPAFEGIEIPLLSDIPVVGQALFHQPVLTYFTYLLVPICWWIMQKSTLGFSLRAVGENPSCADTLGINVFKTRLLSVLTCGALCGLSGAVLALQQVRTFNENMSAGRGWLGIVAAVFGGWNPLGATGASLIFGIAEALQLRLQMLAGINISSYLIQMFPYIIALLFIAFLGKSRRHPAAMSKFYKKT